VTPEGPASRWRFSSTLYKSAIVKDSSGRIWGIVEDRDQGFIVIPAPPGDLDMREKLKIPCIAKKVAGAWWTCGCR
jgi:hypothetical protein